MTWGRYDDHAPFHRKWLTLSNDAVATMWRATQWARSREAEARPGFVTLKELRSLSGRIGPKRFKHIVEELVDAGKPAHEVGLLEPVEDGFVIHNFKRYGPKAEQDAPAADRSDSARRAGQASAEARRARNGSAQPRSKHTTHSASGLYPSAERLPNDSRTTPERFRSNGAERLPNDSRTPVPDPGRDPKAAAATQDLTGSARVRASSEAAAAAPATPEKVSCPNDLALSDEHRSRLAADGVPDYAMAAGTTRFVGKSRSDLTDHRTLTAWRKSLFAAVHGMWLDPKQRPKSPDSFEKPGPVKTKGDDFDDVIMPDGTTVRT